jgi:hypothetical protein
MAMNDFAGPIINAFMQGKQMKRQTEQDILQAEQQKEQLKRQEAELKRLETQHRLQLQLGRMQIENALREQVASGLRKIPRFGGVEAPMINPIAQNLAPTSLPEGMPELVQPQATPPAMLLGQEFAVPEVVDKENAIVDYGEFGKFDISKMTTPQEVLQRQAQEAQLKSQIKLGEVANTEAIKGKVRSTIQAQSDDAAMERAKLQSETQKEVAGKFLSLSKA